MKSHVSVLCELWRELYLDACAKCVACPPDLRDIQTVMSRVKDEGISFLTITLPSLGSDLEQALASGGIDSTHFRSFRKYGKAPAFLRGFFSLIFNHGTGGVSGATDEITVAVECIRQLAYAFKKLKLQCTRKRVNNTLQSFTEIEQNISSAITGDQETAKYTAVCDILWGSVLGNLPNVYTLIPKHGPGATAERLSGNRKFTAVRWHDRLERFFPMLHNRFSSETAYNSKEFENVTIVEPEDEQPVRVIPVPKTLKGPRIIAIEPVCMQYAQQAIAGALVPLLESHPITRGHVNFTDQSVNQRLAMIASRNGEMATLDLSSASDRVPLSLSMRMFDKAPDYQGAIFACRSRRAEMPDGTLLHLGKFASMGSALCFPIEAMYFYTLCIMALLEEQSLPVTYSSIKKVAKHVYVYGDDIIVPTTSATIVIDTLQKYHCKVNVRKSFFTGYFRESCGQDAFLGEDVTPTYIRESIPDDRRNASALISLTKTCNLLYLRGYWKAASYIKDACEKTLGALPIVGDRCGALGLLSYQSRVSAKRWNREYQRLEIKAWIPTPVHRSDVLAGYGALTKCLQTLERRVSTSISIDESHLVSTPRHGAVTLKRRWTVPY